MVLQNYVELSDGVPARMHFYDHAIVRKTITDPTTGKPSARNALVFDCDQVNGQEVETKFSTMSEKLAGLFQPYLADKSYVNYEFVVTASGEGFRRTFTLQAIPKR